MHDGVESVVVISGVVNGTHGTVWFDEGVLSLDNITVAFFSLGLDVTGVGILDAIVERVFRVGLHERLSKDFCFVRTLCVTSRVLSNTTYNRLSNDMFHNWSSMQNWGGVHQSSVVSVINWRCTGGNGKQGNGNEALERGQNPLKLHFSLEIILHLFTKL